MHRVCYSIQSILIHVLIRTVGLIRRSVLAIGNSFQTTVAYIKRFVRCTNVEYAYLENGNLGRRFLSLMSQKKCMEWIFVYRAYE